MGLGVGRERLKGSTNTFLSQNTTVNSHFQLTLSPPKIVDNPRNMSRTTKTMPTINQCSCIRLFLQNSRVPGLTPTSIGTSLLSSLPTGKIGEVKNLLGFSFETRGTTMVQKARLDSWSFSHTCRNPAALSTSCQWSKRDGTAHGYCSMHDEAWCKEGSFWELLLLGGSSWWKWRETHLCCCLEHTVVCRVKNPARTYTLYGRGERSV